ncbi:predicted protein [Verticillium alfalfae VaMs.102]|uniref:Predicted protein n=1 Tax=Verticillium alfalfae (strain VaMs.102 / ATCC MYA-4576 / FGSC 10136) TaxID=526221 RepID=C9SL26_VERA1|nr:predicted protein [Verticillium alfalfae VaMs.102]EEY19394.1 predicted protein [Verticillium alfalfae VaMs.102]
MAGIQCWRIRLLRVGRSTAYLWGGRHRTQSALRLAKASEQSLRHATISGPPGVHNVPSCGHGSTKELGAACHDGIPGVSLSLWGSGFRSAPGSWTYLSCSPCRRAATASSLCNGDVEPVGAERGVAGAQVVTGDENCWENRVCVTAPHKDVMADADADAETHESLAPDSHPAAPSLELRRPTWAIGRNKTLPGCCSSTEEW